MLSTRREGYTSTWVMINRRPSLLSLREIKGHSKLRLDLFFNLQSVLMSEPIFVHIALQYFLYSQYSRRAAVCLQKVPKVHVRLPAEARFSPRHSGAGIPPSATRDAQKSTLYLSQYLSGWRRRAGPHKGLEEVPPRWRVWRRTYSVKIEYLWTSYPHFLINHLDLDAQPQSS